jgi:hypothetical protein
VAPGVGLVAGTVDEPPQPESADATSQTSPTSATHGRRRTISTVSGSLRPVGNHGGDPWKHGSFGLS